MSRPTESIHDVSLDSRPVIRKLTERYDQAAEAYRDLWAPILRQAALPLIRELRADGAARILDIGTGVGALLPDLASAFPGAAVAGVDRSRGMLALAPGRYGRALMDARALAFAPGSADRVFLLFMLFHLEDPAAALREARRILRPGGCVGTLTWARDLESRADGIWKECLDEHGAVAPDATLLSRHENVDTVPKMTVLLERAGFERPRAWEDDLACRIDEAHLIRLKTGLGSERPRFDSLPPAVAAACIDEARRRMRALEPEDFIARGRVVYAVASR